MGPDQHRGASSGRGSAVALLLAAVVTVAFGLWIVSPRFTISGPSMIDDWFAIDGADRAFDDLVRFQYDPEAINDTRRYRPGSTAVWSALEWRTFGAPQSMTGPNVWNVLRITLFLVGLVLLAGFVLTSVSPDIRPVWLGVWSAAPGIAILATPTIGQDLARLGPQEPLLVGGMACGGALLIAGMRLLLPSERTARTMVAAAVALVAGYLLWLLGVYQKEPSVCFLVLAPFLYWALQRRWDAEEVIDRPLHTYWAFRVVAALALLPVAHMAIEVLRLGGEETTVYGSTVPSGIGGWLSRVWDGAEVQADVKLFLGTDAWKGVAAAAVLLCLSATLKRGRAPWLPIGLLVAAATVFLFQGLSQTAASRYFIPVIALIAIASVALLSLSDRWLRALSLVALAAFVLQGGTDLRNDVSKWAEAEDAGHATIVAIAGLNPARCPVYTALMHAEEADAVPELVALQPQRAGGCDTRFRALMVQGRTALPPVTNEAIYRACSGRGWQPLRVLRTARVYGCRRLAKRAYGQPVDDVLRWNRLVPGERLSERLQRLPDSELCEAPACDQPLRDVRAAYR